VHAEDLAIGAIAAAGSPAAVNKIYCLPGGETLSYRELIGGIFYRLRLPRRMISMSTALRRMAFALAHPLIPDANVAMGLRDPGYDLRRHACHSRRRLESALVPRYSTSFLYAISSREPGSTSHQVRARLSLENALVNP